LKTLDDLLRGVRLAIAGADDLQDLVQRIEDKSKAVEDVDARVQRVQLVLQPARHHFMAEVQEVPEDGLQIEPLGSAHVGIFRRHQAGEG
jgi:hypothetical protein